MVVSSIICQYVCAIVGHLVRSIVCALTPLLTR
jgi:hypothetical protein